MSTAIGCGRGEAPSVKQHHPIVSRLESLGKEIEETTAELNGRQDDMLAQHKLALLLPESQSDKPATERLRELEAMQLEDEIASSTLETLEELRKEHATMMDTVNGGVLAKDALQAIESRIEEMEMVLKTGKLLFGQIKPLIKISKAVRDKLPSVDADDDSEMGISIRAADKKFVDVQVALMKLEYDIEKTSEFMTPKLNEIRHNELDYKSLESGIEEAAKQLAEAMRHADEIKQKRADADRPRRPQ
jgi:hypothetical protein